MLDDSFRIRYKNAPVAISEQDNFNDTNLHNHSEFEIILIKSGSCTVCIAGREYPAKANDIIFINPMEIHEVHVNNDVPYSHKCMCFDMSMVMNNSISESLKNKCKSVIHIVTGDSNHGAYLRETFEKAFSEVKNEGKTFAMETTAYLMLMFSYILKNNLVNTKHKTPVENKFCNMVLADINEHSSEITTSTQVADACFLNHSYFCRKFKENFGVSFSEYLNRYRISVARTMLEEDHHNVSEVSQLCGFETPTYFSRCFKNHVGVLPLEYKKGKRSL